MAAAQTKQKTNMFRRMMSPKSKHSDKAKSEKPRPSSLSNANIKHLNGHGRNEIVSSLEVENSSYRDPELLHDVSHPGRSQSMVYPTSNTINLSPMPPAGASENPPLPPRNIRPASIGHSPQQLLKKAADEEQPLYVAPVDTLNRQPNVIVSPNYSHVETPADVFFSRKDIKKMSMHIETMKQTTGHRRVRSIGHVVDSSEYSTPFDLLKENQSKGETALPLSVRGILDKPTAPPKPPQNHRQMKQIDTEPELDDIIPVISPTSPPTILCDRSPTNSPSSPISTQSSEQEFFRDDGTNDYDEPWHDKFKEFDMPTITQQHHHRSPRFTGPQHFDGKTRSNSGPSPVDHLSMGYRGRDPSSISPEVPHERPLTFVKGGYNSNSGRSEGSVSPNPRVRDARSYSHSQTHHPGFHSHVENLGHGVNPRTNSVSMMGGRQLPLPPMERAGPERGLGLDHRYVPKETSPPPVLIDISIPLEDQP